MAKKVLTLIKLQIPGGQANPAPCWPSAGPTGGAGFACPPGICSLISVRTFLAIAANQGSR